MAFYETDFNKKHVCRCNICGHTDLTRLLDGMYCHKCKKLVEIDIVDEDEEDNEDDNN